MKRTASATELNLGRIGELVVLNGWVDTRRDHGGLIFVDLRDRSGIVQVVFSPDFGLEAFQLAESVRSEYVVAVQGVLVARSEETFNPNLETGAVEVQVERMELYNRAKTPPFYIEDGVEVDELLRLRYRYLDLRRPEMKDNLLLRHRVIQEMRGFLDEQGFIEIETPILTKSTPEGARDYLVPSRVHPGEFFALPQSPQIFKQLLMVAGMEKYFQIARCFRDEDLRADRQPEFTQLDMELSFVDEEDIFALIEGLMDRIFRVGSTHELSLPIPRISYAEAMLKYGADKPDLRFGLEIQDLTDLLREVEFKVFSGAIAAGGVVRCINARGAGAAFARREIDELGKRAIEWGAKGMAWINVAEDELKSPITKFLKEEEIQGILTAMKAEAGDLLIFGADSEAVVCRVLGALRLELGQKLNLIDDSGLSFVWVDEFPLFEFDEEEKRLKAVHHMFTAPRVEDLERLAGDPATVRARAYDLILNGVEIGGGSIRIHDRDLQSHIFELIGLTKEEAQDKFGYMLEAFEYGTPPHGGFAFGVDRLVMLMAGRDSIRDVIAFPKTQSAACPLTSAPSAVSNRQLRELSLNLRENRS